MCGIIGVIATRPAAPLVLETLRRLEYRGYDSAGIATLVNGEIDRRRAPGKLFNLAAILERQPLAGTTGIGHTRWATHGAPTESNAHPHGTARVAVVHNGIIENHAELRAELEAAGQTFTSETDTETVAQLVDLNLRRGMAPVEAAGAALARIEGAYALAMVFAGHPELLVGACHGAPLAVGFGEGEMFIGSDALALAPLTRRIAFLRDGDWAVVSRDGAVFRDATNAEVQREVKLTALSGALVGRGNYRHFMEKELHEHPGVIGDTLHQMVDPATRAVRLPPLPFDPKQVTRVSLSGCGGAYFAALAGRHWLEEIARLPADVDVASEFRYREPPTIPGSLGLLVSQSGETADTIAVLNYMKSQGMPILSVVNVPESTMARYSDAVLQTIAGPEIAVASTKAFTAQLTVLACFAVAVARARGTIDAAREAALTQALLAVPAASAEVLDNATAIQRVARRIAEARDVLYLGRGANYAIALEGALKLKEICYIHAEGYAAGEMKHGPIALIDDAVPVIVLAPSGPLFEKTVSNMQEVRARGGRIILISDAEGIAEAGEGTIATICMPKVHPLIAPLVYAVPVQLLAYHVAVLKGTDVDQPRNLAKSVTVE